MSEKVRSLNKKEKILYGAGAMAKKALQQYGKQNVYCFVDRDPQKVGSELEGVPIISVDEFCRIYRNYDVILSTDYFRSVLQDLRELGVDTSGFRPFCFERKQKWYEKNLFLKECVIHKGYKEFNTELEEIIKRAKQWDLIESNEDFVAYEDQWRELRQTQPERGGFEIRYKSVFAESLSYGHLQALFYYAGIPLKNAIYLPNIEHGITLRGVSSQPFPTNAVVSSARRRRLIHQFRPESPVFCVGPLIHYAQGFYTAEQLEACKRRLGKTLLLFPAHSHETVKAVYGEEKYVNMVLERYAGQYDTILACIFYNDLFGETCRLFRERGVHVVSCGFRFDPYFIRRLKTLLLLCDHISMNQFSTSLGYALYFNRPVELWSPDEVKLDFYGERMEDEAMLQKTAEFFKVFAPNGFRITERQKALVEDIWGEAQIKTPQEIEAIVAVCKRILWKSWGDLKNYPNAAIKVLNSLSRRQDGQGVLQYTLLRGALGLDDKEGTYAESTADVYCCDSNI